MSIDTEKVERIASSAKDRFELLTLKLIGMSHLADLEDYGEEPKSLVR